MEGEIMPTTNTTNIPLPYYSTANPWIGKSGQVINITMRIPKVPYGSIDIPSDLCNEFLRAFYSYFSNKEVLNKMNSLTLTHTYQSMGKFGRTTSLTHEELNNKFLNMATKAVETAEKNSGKLKSIFRIPGVKDMAIREISYHFTSKTWKTFMSADNPADAVAYLIKDLLSTISSTNGGLSVNDEVLRKLQSYGCKINNYKIPVKPRLKIAVKENMGGAKSKFKPQVTAIKEAGAAAESTESQVIKQGEKAVAKATGKAAGKTVAKTIVKRGLAILGPVTTAWGIYDILSGKDFPVHSGGIYKAEAELTSTQYSEKEHDDALELYNRLNQGKGSIKNFKSYPTFFVYIKFAKDERIQNMPTRKVKAMINLTIDCINKKYFTASKFTVDDTIKAFNDLEKMNGLFRK